MERKYLKAWKKFLDENTDSAVDNIDEDLNEQDPKPSLPDKPWLDKDKEIEKEKEKAPDPNEQ